MIDSFYPQATDSCGNSVTEIQTITVEDKTAPTLNVPGNVELQCAESLDTSSEGVAGEATGEDECPTSEFFITETDTLSGTACNEVISRTWTVSDYVLHALLQ